MDRIETLRGKFLIAMPDMGDPRFAGSVIYMCAHSDAGAMGLIVNRPRPEITFARLIAHMDIACGPDCRTIPVHTGGPVERARGFVLHTMDYTAGEGTLDVADGIGMTATQDVLVALAQGDGPRQAVLALGCASWGPGQIESELAGNGWLTGPADDAVVFGADAPGKWAAALRLMGVAPQMLSGHGGRA